MKLNLSDRILVHYLAGGVAAEILSSEMKKPTSLSVETLAKQWLEAKADDVQGKEEFPEHGDAWVSFRIEAV